MRSGIRELVEVVVRRVLLLWVAHLVRWARILLPRRTILRAWLCTEKETFLIPLDSEVQIIRQIFIRKVHLFTISMLSIIILELQGRGSLIMMRTAVTSWL